ncbi:MAG: hypothetical protein QM642_11555 [Edaphocola sp.]
MSYLNLLINLCACSCSGPLAGRSAEAGRFEAMVAEAKLASPDSLRYVLWNGVSCGGCRGFAVGLLASEKLGGDVRYIIPLDFAAELPVSPEKNKSIFIDSFNVFGKKYIGIDNIGIVKVANNKVYSIKSYRSDEMEKLKSDLLR